MKILRECTICVMDESANDIQFDEFGQCNYCKDMLIRLEKFQPSNPDVLKLNLNKLLSKNKMCW